MQAESVRVPFAHVAMVKGPEAVSDEQATTISDTHPTARFGAELAEVGDGDVVAVFGAGPVGLFAALSAFQRIRPPLGCASRLPRRRGLRLSRVRLWRQGALVGEATLPPGG